MTESSHFNKIIIIKTPIACVLDVCVCVPVPGLTCPSLGGQFARPLRDGVHAGRHFEVPAAQVEHASANQGHFDAFLLREPAVNEYTLPARAVSVLSSAGHAELHSQDESLKAT